MIKQQIELIQKSWILINHKADDAGLLFYKKLFEAAPGIRHLFQPDISGQANKLMVILDYIVTNLDNLEELVPEVQKLGARHNSYGAQPSHYEIVGQCLVATLKEQYAELWTVELQDAWVTAYHTLKNIMIVAQDEERRADKSDVA